MEGDETFGGFIRRHRFMRGLTQAQLSAHICEPESLSRIENGDRFPRDYIAEQLLDRLGVTGLSSYFGVKDISLLCLKNDLLDAVRFGEDEEIERLLIELKSASYEKRTDVRQTVEFTEAIWKYNLDKDILAFRESLEKILEETVFSEGIFGEWNSYIGNKYYEPAEKTIIVHNSAKPYMVRGLSEIEVMIINAMGATYILNNQPEVAIFLYEELRTMLRRLDWCKDRFGKAYTMVSYNQGLAYYQQGRLKEAEEACRQAIRKGSGYIDSLLFLKMERQWCRFKMQIQDINEKKLEQMVEILNILGEQVNQKSAWEALADGGMSQRPVSSKDVIFIIR